MLSTRERRGCEKVKTLFPSVILRSYVSLIGKKNIPLTLYPIIECLIRGLLRNLLMKLMEHGLSAEIHMESYGFSLLDPEVMKIMTIHFSSFPIHSRIHSIHC